MLPEMPPKNLQPKPPPGLYPPPLPFHIPYFIPPHLAIPYNIMGPPMEVVDSLLPRLRFSERPDAYKLIIISMLFLFIIGLGFNTYSLANWTTDYYLRLIFITLVLLIIMFCVASILLLLIPKKVGWYFAFITTLLVMPIFSLLILIGQFIIPLIPTIIWLVIGLGVDVFIIITLMWPSVRFYFHTGRYQSTSHIPSAPPPTPPTPPPPAPLP